MGEKRTEIPQDSKDLVTGIFCYYNLSIHALHSCMFR